MTIDEQTAAATKRPSISDVAEVAGVSRAAVSKVIRDAYGVSPTMRRRVEKAIDQLNYRPRVSARALRGSGFTIGFEAPHMVNDFFNQVMSGSTAGLAASGYQLIIAPDLGYLSGTSVLESLVDRQVDGIIAIASTVPPDWLEDLGRQLPLVVLGRHEPSVTYDTVTTDDTAGVELVMDHLLGLGHRRIAHFTLRPQTPSSPHAIRQLAYRARMHRAGLVPRVVEVETEKGDAALPALTGLIADTDSRPTAIVAGHDALAIDALRAVAESDHQDISVVGYDGIEISDHPLISLTTVDQFGPQMGATATELLLERIRGGRTEPRHIVIEPRLRIRRSTAVAPVEPA